MKVVVFANFFPYKRAEPFLVNEFEISKKYCQQISVFTLYGCSNDSSITQSQQINLYPPVFSKSGSKTQLLLKALFNTAPFDIHLRELFSLNFSLKKMYWCITSLLVTRSILASEAYKRLLNDISKDKSSILYFYWGDNACWIIPYLSRAFPSEQLKIVIRLHGSDLYEQLKADYAPLRKQIFQNANKLVAISEFGKQYLIQRYPEFSSKIEISRLGVFDQGLNPYKRLSHYTLVSVSNVIPLKRLDLIYEVFLKSDLTIDWYHFGDGPDLTRLKEKTGATREGLRIHWMGYVQNAQIISFYQSQSVDLFMNLSSTEGLPVSIMEALSFGIPVLAPNIGGIGDIVNENNGKLISHTLEAQTIADELKQVLQAENYDQLRKNARKMFEEKVSAPLNYSAFYSELEKFYKF